MALFKILKGTATNLHKKDANGNPAVPIREGYCYFTTDEHQMWVDLNNTTRVCLNAAKALTADKLTNARTISLGGDANGSIAFDGSNNVTIQNTVTTPMAYIYHDLLAFNSYGAPSFYTTTNGSTWTSATLSNIPFDQKDTTAIILFSDSITGYRWQWNNNQFNYSGFRHLLTSWKYTDPRASVSIQLQISSDGSTWTNSGSIWTGSPSSEWIRMSVTSSNQPYVRLTILKTSSSGTSSLSSIKLMTNRPGDQGGGRENEFPYTWDSDKNMTARNKIYGAVWNDYAEYRICKDKFKPGQVIIENGDDTMSISTARLQPGAEIISDTFGFSIGETDDAKCPIAVSGRVLAYCYEDKYSYQPGDAVCSGPNGTVSKMTREEIREYPERIIGTVSAIPEYEEWGTGKVKVDGRIWIKVK